MDQVTDFFAVTKIAPDDVALFQILRRSAVRGDGGYYYAVNIGRDAQLLPEGRGKVLNRDATQRTFRRRLPWSGAVGKIARALFDGKLLMLLGRTRLRTLFLLATFHAVLR
jgi:hypothetical protein